MPIEIAPAMSSATPPRMTSLDSPRDERPAARANGTVRPSERPMTLLEEEINAPCLFFLQRIGQKGAESTTGNCNPGRGEGGEGNPGLSADGCVSRPPMIAIQRQRLLTRHE